MRRDLTRIWSGGLGLCLVLQPGAHPADLAPAPQPPVITRHPADTLRKLGGRARFGVLAEGQALTYQWEFNHSEIPGATDSTLTLSNLTVAAEGSYRVRVVNSGGATRSAPATLTVVSPPVITAQPRSLQLAHGSPFTFSVTATSRVEVAYEWYLNGRRYQAIAAGTWNGVARRETAGTWQVAAIDQTFLQRTLSEPWTLAVPLPGAIVEWAAPGGRRDAPADLTNIAAIAVGPAYGLALTSEGTVVTWGTNSPGPPDVPAGSNDVQAISAGRAHALALRYDGTVMGWGQSPPPPAGLSGVVAVAAGHDHSLALREDGQVTAWGAAVPKPPADLRNVVGIASGAMSGHALAVRGDGTVAAWGQNDHGQTVVPRGLSGVVSVAAGASHSLGLKRDGTVVAWGSNRRGQCDVPSGLSNVMAIAAGFQHSLALRNDGSLVSWGGVGHTRDPVPAGMGEVTAIAAGDRNLALIYSSTVQYPVRAAADLLVIYNTSSPDSVALKDYYLSHRPLAGDANTLGVACLAAESISLAELQRTLRVPVIDWLAAHPTRRPRYVVLMLGIPSRRSVPTTPVPGLPIGSVSHVLRETFPVRKPFVTHLHMGRLADCKAYIDKLRRVGDRYSPGRLVLRPSRGGYGGSRFYLDDVTVYSERPGSAAKSALIAHGLPPASVVYSASEHVRSAADVAGFMSWGSNGGLGGAYANDGTIGFRGQSDWFLLQTIESFNGQRVTHQGNFIDWFAANAFGGTGYAHTPVGAVSYTEEPSTGGVNDASLFVHWAAGRDLGTCAWNSARTADFQVVGDPLVAR